MAKNDLPDVGDVITSSQFAYGSYENEDKKLVTVDGKTTNRPVTFSISEDERVALAAETGTIPPKKRTVELGAYDASRGTAKFVVETAVMKEEDEYSAGAWRVQARRLNDDGSYNPNGESIWFYMTGYSCLIQPKDVQIIGKMQLKFV